MEIVSFCGIFVVGTSCALRGRVHVIVLLRYLSTAPSNFFYSNHYLMSIPIFAAPQLPTQPSASSNLSSTAPRPRTRSLLLFSPLTYGNSATPLQVPAQDPSHTHKWTVYLRTDPNIIERVTFTLHASFHQPERILKHPPYEVTETGWGEFEIAINIRFHHEEKDVTIYHHLKLHTGADTIQGNVPGTIICEKYDELVSDISKRRDQ